VPAGLPKDTRTLARGLARRHRSGSQSDTDSAKGGSELIIMYMYARSCMRWGVQYYLWGSGACGTALFAPKYALLRRTAGKYGSGREKLTFYRPKVGICTE